MSDDEADPELLELLRKSLGLGGGPTTPPPAETKVLESAQYIFDNAVDVAVNMSKTKEAAETIWRRMQEKEYSTKTWSEHELHPKSKDESTVDFIFTMDLLNFSFWSDTTDDSKRFAIEYRGRRWTGYWSLVAALQRALDEGKFDFISTGCHVTFQGIILHEQTRAKTCRDPDHVSRLLDQRG